MADKALISYRSVGGYAPTDPGWTYTGETPSIGNGSEPLTAPRGNAMRCALPDVDDVFVARWQGFNWTARIIAFTVRMVQPFGRLAIPEFATNPEPAEPAVSVFNAGGDITPVGSVVRLAPSFVDTEWATLIYDLGAHYSITGVRLQLQAVTGSLCDIGLLWVGNAFEVIPGFREGHQLGRLDRPLSAQSDAGQQYFTTIQQHKRVLKLQLNFQDEDTQLVTATEGWLRIRDELNSSRGVRPALIIPRDWRNATTERMSFIGWPTFQDFGHTGSTYWGTELTIEEVV